MITWKAALRVALALFLLLRFFGCKKSPVETALEVEEPTIILICNPAAGAQDEIISVSVFIKGNKKEIRVFGLEVTFDSQMFRFQGVRKGTLTGGWAAVAGNEIGVGWLRVGGFVGSGTAIPVPSEGTLVDILFKVTGGDYGNAQQSQVCIKEYTDALSDFKPVPACSTFTLKK